MRPQLKKAAAAAKLKIEKHFKLLSPDGEIIECIGVIASSKKLGLSSSFISEMLNGKRQQTKGWSLI